MKRRAGFTLVEVLVALVIVALGVGALLSALTSAASTTARLRTASFAEWIGFNQIATVRLQLQQPAAGTTTGELDYANSHWAWEQSVATTDIAGLMRITVKVKQTGALGESGQTGSNAPWSATTTGFKGDALNASLGQSVNWNGMPSLPGPGGPGAGTTVSGSGGGGGTGQRGAIISGDGGAIPGGGAAPGGRGTGGGASPPGQP